MSARRFAPTALAVSALGWPLPALWAALGLFMVTRLVTMVARYAGLRWAVASRMYGKLLSSRSWTL